MIELVEVTKRYGAAVVVDRVSLRVEAGTVLALLGGSGSGKTTTLKMINRLVEATSGTVRFDGEDASALAPWALRRRIGYVAQRAGLFPHMTVAENVGITPRLLGWDAGRIRARVDELLEVVELAPSRVRERRPHELSGGEQQRVGLARALAAEPRAMLLDEPFGALDPLTRDRLQSFFLTLQARIGLTAVFVTHDMVEALRVGHRVAVMQAGALVEEGTPADLYNRPSTDYVRELMATPRAHAELVRKISERTGAS